MAVIAINLSGPKDWLYDYWNLDNEDETPPGKLDYLRSPWVACGACVVLVGAFTAYLVFRH
jgi:hypothetical protein